MTERKPTCVACKGAGGGANYTAGTGIKIESNEISADTSVLATKTELPDMDDYQEKLTAGTGIDITSNEVSIDQQTVALKSDIIPGYELVSPEDYSSLVSSTSLSLTLLKDICIEKDGCRTYWDKNKTFSGTNPYADINGLWKVEGRAISMPFGVPVRKLFLETTSSISASPHYLINVNQLSGVNDGQYQFIFSYESNSTMSRSDIKIYARD